MTLYINNNYTINLLYFFSGLTYDEVLSFVPPSFDGDEMESWERSTFSSISFSKNTL